jgi:tRNA threonylcarbamoyladenosine biosynthesis protein TsaB
MLLSLDTATRHSGIALYDGTRLLAELTWHSTDAQTVELMPRLAQLLDWHGVKPAELVAVAVSLGPGSYTGLRVAVSAAKGMALAHGLPLFGIPTLDATVFPQLGRPEPVCAVIQAGRGRLLWSIYRPERAVVEHQPGAQPIRLGSWAGLRSHTVLSDVQELARAVREPTWFVGELSPELSRALHDLAGETARVMPLTVAARRAGVIAELAWLRLQAGDHDDLASLSPIYLREP